MISILLCTRFNIWDIYNVIMTNANFSVLTIAKTKSLGQWTLSFNSSSKHLVLVHHSTNFVTPLPFVLICLSNKAWKHVVDQSQEWLHSKLQIYIIHFDQLIVKEHNRTNRVVTATPEEEQQIIDVVIVSLEGEPHMTY
jgi:hypothetical protein